MYRIVFGAVVLLHSCFLTAIIGSPLDREKLTSDFTDISNTFELTKIKTDLIENATKSSINLEIHNNNIYENKNEEQRVGINVGDQNDIKSESSSSVETTENSSGVNSSPNSSIKSSDHPTSSNDTDTTKNETIEHDDNIISGNDTLLGGHDPEATKKYIDSKLMFWKDDFMLSIITPVGIGLGCALSILGIIACCRCFTKKLCWGKKRMANSRIRGDIRKMKHKDRVKLLAASSDDEF